jgi:tetratricopeptide (TPR) repeat protein
LKPMGTITKYYPFIDEETKSILETLMNEASSYYKFVERLCETVLENEVPINLGYLAAVHAWWTRKRDSIEHIHEKFKDIPYIRPWKYATNLTFMDQEQYHDAIVEAIVEAMETPLDDWILTELHLLHAYIHYPYLGDVPSLLEPLEKAKHLVEADPLLKCFESLIYTLEGWTKGMEGYVDDSLDVLKKGHELAEVYDDSLYKYLNLVNQEAIFLYINIKSALARGEDLYDLAQDLEVPFFIAEVLNESAVAFETAGEYDLAISSHLEVRKIVGESDWTSQMLSRIYASLGDGQKALQEINQYIENEETSNIPAWYRRARALALLNRVEEAERDLNTVHGQMMKTGSDIFLGSYYHTSGVIEIAKGNYLAALDILEKCWEISERVPRVLNQNYVLLDLARVELQLAKESADTTRSFTPGRWLSKLEKHASDRDLPGIRMQAVLLKSEFYQLHGQLKDAHAILVDALNITDSPGVRTLRKRISNRINELSALMREAAASPERRKE